MTFALDFDGTYDQDPVLWDSFIASARRSGHRVVIVTYRNEELDPDPLLDKLRDVLLVPLYFTNGVAKKWYMKHFGVPVDVWIDNQPETLFENSSGSPSSLEEWRYKNKIRLSEQGYYKENKNG